MSDSLDIEHRAFWEEAERPYIPGVTAQEAADACRVLARAVLDSMHIMDPSNLREDFPGHGT